MLTYGMNLQQANDPLQKVTFEVVANKIRHPRSEFAARIAQLRQIRMIDEKQYRKQKATLPYFCCASFNPPFRRKDNFAAIQYFTLDFDHFSDDNLSADHVKEQLKNDRHLQLLFTTPSGDGLKGLFALSEKCTDPGLYSHFYKSFAQAFSKKYGLEKVIDWVTHDVTRATFFSADLEAYVNPDAQPVNLPDFVSDDMDEHFSVIENNFKQLESASKGQQDAATSHDTLNDQTLTAIKRKLNPNYRPKRKKETFVPEEIQAALPQIKAALDKENISLVAEKSINYGKQLKVQMNLYWAEINVFHGQKGYSVIKTTKTGSHAELAELAYQIIDALLN